MKKMIPQERISKIPSPVPRSRSSFRRRRRMTDRNGRIEAEDEIFPERT